ncbi:MAG: MFS transporter [Halolamina sp.]|uniref:MFS transporter n=1 Tax=Halolamina sp. TaxID=1940283 RepID=UPI002FC2F922
MRERARVLAVTSAVLFLAGLVWYNYSALLPIVADDFGFSGFQSGVVFAAFQLGYVIAILPAGVLADRYDARVIVAAGTTGTGLATVGFAALTDGFQTAAVFRLLAGAAITGVYVPGMRLLTDWYEADDRGGAFGIYVGTFSLSSGMSYFLASIVASSFGWRIAIGATSVGAVLAGPLILLLTRPHPDATAEAAGFDFSLLRDRSYLAAVGIYAGHNWELFGARNWILAFLVAAPALIGTGNPTVIAGTLTGITVALGSVANVASGWLSDRIGRLWTITLVFLASGAISLSLGALRWLPLSWLTVIVLIYGITLTADSSPASTTITELVEETSVGTALALQSFLGFAVTIGSPVAFGAVLDLGGYGWAFPTLAIGPLVGLVAILYLRRQPAAARIT